MHCGFCLPACPTYRRLGDEADSPRGRLYLMQAVVEGRLDPGSEAFQLHIDRCLGCRACEPVCPSGVPYGHLLELARQVGRTAKRPPLAAGLLLAVFSRNGLSRLVLAVSRLFRASRIPSLLARLLPRVNVLRPLRLASAMLAASGRSPAFRSHLGGAVPMENESGLRVGLLKGCVQDGLFRRVNRATERVLSVNGYRVVTPERQQCCGALHAHAGDLEKARELARANIHAFEAADVDLLAMNASGCGAAVAAYGELLEGDPEWSSRGRAIAEKVRDVSVILAQQGPKSGGPVEITVAYDAPCHLTHALGVAEAPVRMLESVPGLTVSPLPRAEECCGGAGIYALTHPELGGRIGGDKVDEVLQSGADAVATGNPGCIMQIGAGLRLVQRNTPVLHPVEILDESYRRGGLYGS